MQRPLNYISKQKSKNPKLVYEVENISNSVKYTVILAYVIFITISGFYFNNIEEIINGLAKIAVSSSILVSDYMSIGNVGSALVNSGILMIISVFMARINKADMNGPVISATFTIGAFSLFGNNIYNIWAIFLGVYLYSVLKKEKFSKYLLVALFGTALAPVVSQISFGLEINIIYGIILGNIFGVIIGFIMPPLAAHFSKFHQGFSLYNMGFTAGIIGALLMSILRAYGKDHGALAIVSDGNNMVFSVYLSIIFISMILVGYILNNKSFAGYKNLLKQSGRAGSDFVASEGFGLAFINMGLTGFLGLIYVAIVKGQLNGSTIGGILTIVAFSGYGKHINNIWPIFLGVFLASITGIWDVNSNGVLLAALFGTTLAPVAGEYGWKIGTLAGFMHLVLVMNTGYLHGWMNLYNNGFAGGIVAGILVPIVDGIVKKD